MELNKSDHVKETNLIMVGSEGSLPVNFHRESCHQYSFLPQHCTSSVVSFLLEMNQTYRTM